MKRAHVLWKIFNELFTNLTLFQNLESKSDFTAMIHHSIRAQIAIKTSKSIITYRSKTVTGNYFIRCFKCCSSVNWSDISNNSVWVHLIFRMDRISKLIHQYFCRSYGWYTVRRLVEKSIVLLNVDVKKGNGAHFEMLTIIINLTQTNVVNIQQNKKSMGKGK